MPGKSQKLPDSTMLPNQQIKTLLKIAKELQYTSAELANVKQENNLLYQRITVKDTLIAQGEVKADLLNKMVENKILETENLLQQKSLLMDCIKQSEKNLRKQKHKTFFVGLLGTLTNALVTFLFITKW